MLSPIILKSCRISVRSVCFNKLSRFSFYIIQLHAALSNIPEASFFNSIALNYQLTIPVACG
jgi:hypothetical protein